jgi:hypothetical protein
MKSFTTMFRLPVLFAAVCAVGLAGCEQTKSASPLSPSLAGPIAGVVISSPAPMQPAAGQKFKDSEQPLTLTFSNADSNGVRPFKLQLQIGADAAFATVVYSQGGIEPAADGVNKIVLPARLQAGRNYFWRTKADDGANASDWSEPIPFEILQPIVIGVPNPVSPVGGVRVTGATTAALRAQNGVSSGPHGVLSYQFQASTTPSFSAMIANIPVPQGNGETSYTVGHPSPDTLVYWRVRITDGTNEGAWSRVETYRTPAAPTPPPGPGPGPVNPGGPCISSNPEIIVQCERAKFGHMSNDQMLQFMRNVAKSLNSNGIGGGPWGILRKSGGHNCGGYSCDVVCAGNGGGQRQYDVLGDIDGAQVPMFSGPIGNIRVDVCDIQ